MKKINKKRIIILILLIVVIIFEIVALRNSRAAKSFDVSAEIIDTEGKLENETVILPAIAGEAGSYYINLPEVINNKKIYSYIVEHKNINEQNEDKQNEDEQNEEQVVDNNKINDEETQDNGNNIEESNTTTNIIENTINDTPIENNEIIEESAEEDATNEKEEVQILSPNNPLYLSKSEIKDKKIIVKVEYNRFEKDNQVLYEQQISTDVDDNADGIPDNTITIEGLMPLDSAISVKPLTKEEINNSIKDMLNDKVTFKKAYDIKIISNDKEYEPTNFDTEVRVSIEGIEPIDTKTQKYKVVHIDDNNETKEIERC